MQTFTYLLMGFLVICAVSVSFSKNLLNSIIDEKEFLDKLPAVAELAIGDACTGSNPRIPTQEEMEKLLKCCYYDLEVDF